VEIHSEPQRCSRAVLDQSFPGISFAPSGQAEQVRFFESKVKPKWLESESNDAELKKVLGRIQRKAGDSEYDSILGLSGGLDSSYMLHLAVKELGLRPLVFHVDGGWNTETAVQNIRALVDGLSLDLYTEVIEWDEMRRLQLAWFRAGVPHLDIPQDHAFVATLYRYAEKFGIRTILNGGNLATEGLRNPLKYFYYGTDMRHIRDVIGRTNAGKFDSFPFSPVLRHKLQLRFLKGIEVVKPLNLLRFRKFEAEKVLNAEYGWVPYAQKHFESRFTRFYEGHWLPKRFGFDPRTVQLSSLIVTDQISREDALEQLSIPALDDRDVARETAFVASKLGIQESELQDYFEMPQKYYWDFKNSLAMFDMGARVLQLFGNESTRKS